MAGRKLEDRITPELAREIREELHSTDKSAREIALERGMNERSVQNVISGRTHLAAGGPIRKIEAPARLEHLDDAKIRKIRVLKGFKSSKAVAEQFKCSEGTVRAIWTNRMRATQGRTPFGRTK